MTFTVVWVDSAERELAEVWLTATNRAVVTAAARSIDQRLGINLGREPIAVEAGSKRLRRQPA